MVLMIFLESAEIILCAIAILKSASQNRSKSKISPLLELFVGQTTIICKDALRKHQWSHESPQNHFYLQFPPQLAILYHSKLILDPHNHFPITSKSFYSHMTFSKSHSRAKIEYLKSSLQKCTNLPYPSEKLYSAFLFPPLVRNKCV